jgi:hypothetical protein
MKKILSVDRLGAALLSPTLALAADDLADKYFTGKNPTLTLKSARPSTSPSDGTRALRPA